MKLARWWLIACACAVAAADPARGSFPEGYRQWTLVRFRFIGPESPQWSSQGGLRHYFANPEALASWGRFREGSIIVDERVHARLDARQVWEEAGLAHVAVMRKDARFADTGGWEFSFFTNGDPQRGLTAEQTKARCFDACHRAQAARDYVFSDPRR